MRLALCPNWLRNLEASRAAISAMVSLSGNDLAPEASNAKYRACISMMGNWLPKPGRAKPIHAKEDPCSGWSMCL